jgi:hypothetical protein
MCASYLLVIPLYWEILFWDFLFLHVINLLIHTTISFILFRSLIDYNIVDSFYQILM